MTVVIPLTQGQVALVDAADYGVVAPYRWSVTKSYSKMYARTSVRHGTQVRKILMHRLIMQPGPDELVDFRNGNGLDCRRSNLRVASKAQDQHNAKKHRSPLYGRPTSHYKGVYRLPGVTRGKAWKATICVGQSRTKHLGLYETEKEAALAYDRAARELFGEFALVNFPTPDIAGLYEPGRDTEQEPVL